MTIFLFYYYKLCLFFLNTKFKFVAQSTCLHYFKQREPGLLKVLRILQQFGEGFPVQRQSRENLPKAFHSITFQDILNQSELRQQSPNY